MQYKDFIANPAAQTTDFAQKYKQRILAASQAPTSKGTYVPGDGIHGDELRTFADEPIICGPLVCQLCDKDFISEKSFADHKKTAHAGESEYRKRILYLYSERGCRPITAQEKRLMVEILHTSNNTAIQERRAIISQTGRKSHDAKLLARSAPGRIG